MTIELGNRLAQLRKEKGISQEELADKLGVSRQAVSKWERGEASPDTDNLIELAKIYNISLDELVGNKKEEKEEKHEEKKEETKTSGGIHITDEDGSVRIDKTGIHVTDKDDGEVHITKNGVEVEVEEKGVKVNKKCPDYDGIKDRQRITAIRGAVWSISILLAAIAYLVLGFTLDLFNKAWVLFILAVIIPSIYETIALKSINRLPVVLITVFIYLTLCVWVFNFHLWHPLWIIFLIPPVYYRILSLVRVAKRK